MTTKAGELFAGLFCVQPAFRVVLRKAGQYIVW
jgi:hypothetical protein